MPRNEKVEVKLPSGETVVAIVPAGMDDARVGALMRQKHPEYFPQSKPSDDDRSQIAGAMFSPDDRSQAAGAVARMPQPGTTPQAEQGPVRRFLTRAMDLPEGVFDRPGEYLNPFSKAYWNPTPQRQAEISSMLPSNEMPPLSAMVPGQQTLSDIRARNYAGAAGDVLPDAFAVAQMAVPAAGEVMQMPSVSRMLPRAGRYIGAGAGFEAGGPLGAAAGGIAGDLAGRGLVKLAPRMARSVGVAAPAEATTPATTAAKIQQIRGQRAPGSTASLAKQATDEALARSQAAPTTAAQATAPATKPTVNVDDLASAGRNLGLRPEEAQARARDAVAQFPNDENAAIQYMAGRQAPQASASKASQIKAIQQEKPVAATPSAKAEQIKAVQQEKAGIVNNPEFVSQRQRSNLPKNQRDMAAFKAGQVASAKTATKPQDVEGALQRSIKTLKTPISGGSQAADAITLKDFASVVNDAARDMQGEGVHAHGIGDKVFISEIYDRLKPKLGQMTLDQFKQKILEAKQKVLVIGSAADQAPMYSKTHQIMNTRSKTGGDNSVSFIDAQGK